MRQRGKAKVLGGLLSSLIGLVQETEISPSGMGILRHHGLYPSVA